MEGREGRREERGRGREGRKREGGKEGERVVGGAGVRDRTHLCEVIGGDHTHG